MNAEIGFGMIGTGMVAKYHAAAIAEASGARLSAVCRADASRAAEAAQEFGVPCETGLEALLDRPDVDAVCVCTPSGLHAQQVQEAARAGKHVLVEKPMALSLTDADAMIGACQKAGVHLGVCFQRRTDPEIRELAAAIGAGELGRLVLGTVSVPYFRSQSYYDSATWRGTWSLDGGGALMNQGIHLVDLLLWLMGDEAEVIGASGGAASHEIEVEDGVVAAFRFSQGARGTLAATTAAAPGFPHRVEIYGTKGGAQIEGDGLIRWEGEAPRIHPQGQGTEAAGSGASPTGISAIGHTHIVQDFVESIRDGRQPLVSGAEGRRSLALILDVYRAAGLGPGREVLP